MLHGSIFHITKICPGLFLSALIIILLFGSPFEGFCEKDSVVAAKWKIYSIYSMPFLIQLPSNSEEDELNVVYATSSWNPLPLC